MKPVIRIPARRAPSAGMTVGEAGAVATAFGRYVVGGYTGARSDKSSMQNWRTLAVSADNDTLGDLDTLRARSRDLGRNNPLAVGALSTETTNVVGTGLWPCAAVNAEILGISDDEAMEVGRRAELLWNVFADSTFCDVTRATNFAGLQEIVFRAVLESGDILVVRRQKARPGALVGLSLQLVEADRIRTPAAMPETDRLAAGIETDADGEAIRFYVASGYTGTLLNLIGGPETFTTVDAFGRVSGEPLALHVRSKLRDGQRRGVPFLAAVIEPLKQLDRYTESELMAAVVSSFFTVFVKSATGGNLGQMEAGSGPMGGDGIAAPGDIALGPGAVVELGKDEDVTFANPNRPSPQFDPFWLAMVKQIGVALEIPFELLIKHFSSSYSASRAALETAWQHFKKRRAWLASAFCQPVYEWFFAECVARGLIDAPGFFEDPLRRAAWCAATWVGDARISLDQVKDAKADLLMQGEGWKTAEEITAERTGGDWWAKLPKRQREVEARRKAGLEALPVVPGTTTPPGAPSALIGHNGGPAIEDRDEGPGEGDDP